MSNLKPFYLTRIKPWCRIILGNFSLYRRYSRQKLARAYFSESKNLAKRWVSQRTETSNFYYNLRESNREDLVSLLSLLIGIEKIKLRSWIRELDDDAHLNQHIEKFLHSQPETSDSQVGYGRREGWYLMARALKPSVIVETGVDHGVGSCLLASALIRNIAEGFSGEYIGIDINPSAGELLSGTYAEVGRIIYGDSIETIRSLNIPIDLFINDSDHDHAYETREYETVSEFLSVDSVILGDNSHVSNSLREFAESTQRPYVFFKEQPKNHWYPGAGIGISPSKVPIINV